MLDFAGLAPIAPEVLLSSSPLPPPSGPVRLSFAAAPERDAPAMLGACFARIGFRYEMERLTDLPFKADLSLNMLPGVLVAAGQLHGSRNIRRRGIIDDGTDDAVLMINIAGPHLIEQFGKEIVLQNGEAVLLSGTDPSAFTHQPPGRMVGLRIPKAELRPLLKAGNEVYMQTIPHFSPQLRHLTDYVGLTWSAPAGDDGALGAVMARHLQQLVALVVGANRDAAECSHHDGLRVSRINRIKRDIRHCLADPHLTLEQLAARHHCAPRSLQRLFESEGTSFSAFVLAERLQLARGMLSEPRRMHDKISSIAMDCGFGDVSYFNRTFRQRFGAAPSDVRAGLLPARRQ